VCNEEAGSRKSGIAALVLLLKNERCRRMLKQDDISTSEAKSPRLARPSNDLVTALRDIRTSGVVVCER